MDNKVLDVIYVNGQYFMSDVRCSRHHIGDASMYIIHPEGLYFHVTPEEIGDVCALEHMSFVLKKEDTQIYYVMPEEEPDYEFKVYVVQDHYYVDNSVLQKFHIQSLGKQMNIDGTLCFEVSAQQISIIEGSSIYGVWKANYQEITG